MDYFDTTTSPSSAPGGAPNPSDAFASSNSIPINNNPNTSIPNNPQQVYQQQQYYPPTSGVISGMCFSFIVSSKKMFYHDSPKAYDKDIKFLKCINSRN